MNARYHMAANTVIRASAGTGKTYALVETITHLLAGLSHFDGPLKPSQIAAITFTEKAAGEMLERIRLRVERLAELGCDASLEASAQELARRIPARDDWQRTVRELDQLRVQTFHGFCLALLERYPLEAGLDPQFGVYDEADRSHRQEMLAEREVLRALEQPDLRPAVEELLGRLQLRRFGTYGYGLSDQLCAMLSTLHESGLDIDDLPHLGSPEDESANPLVDVVITLVDRLDRRFSAEKRRLGRLDFEDMQRLARNLLRDHSDVRQAVKERFAVVLVDEFQDTNPIQRDLVLMLTEPVDVHFDWRSRPAPGALPEQFQLGRRRLFAVGDPKQSIYDFRGADVSTFQDVEALVARTGGLVDALTVSYRSRPNLVSASNAVFERTLRQQAGETAPWFVHWTEDAALRPHRPESLGTPALHLVDSEVWCRQRSREVGRPIRLDLATEFDAVARLLVDMVDEQRGWSVIDPNASQPRRASFGDVFVLLRRFVSTLGPLTDALARAGVPHYVVKGRGFFASREVADLALALRAVSPSGDDAALVGFLRGPMIGVSDAALARLALHHRGLDRRVLFRASTDPAQLEGVSSADRAALSLAARLIGELNRFGETLGPRHTLEHLLDETDYATVLAALPQGDQALAHVDRVLEMAHDYANRIGASTLGFARRLTELVDLEPPQEPVQVVDEGLDVVRIMTIHQAKGLQCPIAVVPDADPGGVPYPPRLLFTARAGIGVASGSGDTEDPPAYTACKSELSSRRLAEQRRLMYVALTRARDHLVVSGNTPLCKQGGNRAATRFVLQEPAPQSADFMHHLHQLKAERPAWLDVIPLASLDARAPQPPPVVAPPSVDDLLSRPLAGPLEAPRGRLSCAVTQLSDFVRCPRHYWLQWELGLLERGGIESPPDAPDAPFNAALAVGDGGETSHRERGSLAHVVLERVDARRYDRLTPQQRRNYLKSLAKPASRQLPKEAVREVLDCVGRALDGDVGSLLRQRRAIEREGAFVLRVPLANGDERSTLSLHGRIDLLVPGDLVEPPTIIDYKLSAPATSTAPYRPQLLSYALAHHRRTGSPAGATYRLGVVFLRERKPRIRQLKGGLVKAKTLDNWAAELGELGARLLVCRQRDKWPRGADCSDSCPCRQLG